jgi:predicted NACHT family NTPase
MIMEIVIGKITDSILSASISTLKRILKEKSNRIQLDKHNIEESLVSHISMVENWSNEVNFKDLSNSKTTSNIYVHLDFYLTPSKNQFETSNSKTKIEEILNTNKHAVILGQPGAGKTTSMKFLCQKLMHDEEFCDKYNFPIVIRFRDIKFKKYDLLSNILINELFNILGITINYYKAYSKKEEEIIFDKNDLIDKAVIGFLDSLKPLIILDGFDEIFSYGYKQAMIRDLEKITLGLCNAKIILTSRTGEFHYSLANTRDFEICSLTETQIMEFTENNSSFKIHQKSASYLADIQ